MKKIAALILIALCTSCATPTEIIGSWKNPEQTAKSYHNIFVAALTGQTVVKSKIESALKIALAKQNVSAIKSIDEFPPNFLKDTVAKDVLLSAVNKKGADAILTVTMLKKETSSRYVPGGPMYAPYPMYGYYRSFSGYYSYWYPYAYSSGYYAQSDIYFFETNLYDAKTDNLIWSAQSETYTYDGLTDVSADLAHAIVEKMRSDGVLISERGDHGVAVQKKK
ncbi:MAG: hypothetical protein ACXVPQ_10915 [Bacteroidia bacterium]